MGGMSTSSIAAWIAVAIAAVLVVLATQNFRRTKGRNWKFHLIYLAVVVVLWLVLPLEVKRYVFSSAGIAVAGMIFPVYNSLRALCTPATVDDMEWLQYWCAMGGIYFLTAFLKDYHLANEKIQLMWFQFEFFFFIWLYLPFTDGSTLVFDYFTKPVMSPIIDPISQKMNSWISGTIMTIVNASHLWALWAFFIILPKDVKRFATIAVGSVYPILASITAVSTPTKTDDTFWLTYWTGYGLLFITMDWLETYFGRIWGFYTVIIFSTVYLMLPMFQGSDKLFRNVLVPLAGLKEQLLLRDAILLKKDIIASIPADRQKELRKLITQSFDIETPDEDHDDPGSDSRMEVNMNNIKNLWSESIWNRKAGSTNNSNSKGNNGGGAAAAEIATERTSLV